jgi:hypothetical protein
MEITLHNTTKIVDLNGIPARIWEGHTDSGIPVHAYITRIGVAVGEDQQAFESQLSAASAPSPPMEKLPLRLLI